MMQCSFDAVVDPVRDSRLASSQKDSEEGYVALSAQDLAREVAKLD